ncbi:DoxX family protein [Candidatus Parcubacteria bacterium]|nr:MAG: DoxX family protein [Candidatus Parcubacteria bacterium]
MFPSFGFFSKFFLFLLRIAMGWMFFYAGVTKVLNPQWTAEGFLKGAKTFTAFYDFLLQPEILPIVNFTNKWGLTLLGVSLILGIFVRLSSILGALLMILYYLPILQFPYPNPNSYIVDQHVIYALVLLFFAAVRAGRIGGLEGISSRLPVISRFPRLRNWLG